MARRWQESEQFEVPQTPLIDIIFILIVFFLVATTFYTEERDMKVELPEGTRGSAIAKDQERLVINIRAGGIIVINQDVLSLQLLEDQLRSWVKSHGNRDVEIRGDANAKHGRIMEVMNLCKKTGVEKYSVTQRIVQERE